MASPGFLCRLRKPTLMIVFLAGVFAKHPLEENIAGKAWQQ